MSGQGFSYELDPELDAELEAARRRHADEQSGDGLAAAAAIPPPTVDPAVGTPDISGFPDTLSDAEEIRQWAEPKIAGAVNLWRPYRDARLLGQRGDKFYIEGIANPNFATTMQRLYQAQRALDASGELTPKGTPIGDTMQLVAVPWQAFADNLARLPEWLNDMHRVQGATPYRNTFSDALYIAIRADSPMYRLWDNPGIAYSAGQYLEHKIAQDGPWGLMLMQASPWAGTQSLRGKTANEVTSMGAKSPEIAGFPVGSMGVFEWLALTLQTDPGSLSIHDTSMLLANRLIVDTKASIASGTCNPAIHVVYIDVLSADNAVSFDAPRLAVA